MNKKILIQNLCLLALALSLVIGFVIWCILAAPAHDFEYHAIGEAAYTQKVEPIQAVASWYDTAHCLGCHPFKIMKNGKKLENDKFTAAYNDAPLGSRLLIRNGDKQVIVEVTDTLGRDRIDLTKSAFEKIGNPDDGLLNVEIIKL
jgi:rare lipoprotein A (peptidoglycan hydrolase)